MVASGLRTLSKATGFVLTVTFLLAMLSNHWANVLAISDEYVTLYLSWCFKQSPDCCAASVSWYWRCNYKSIFSALCFLFLTVISSPSAQTRSCIGPSWHGPWLNRSLLLRNHPVKWCHAPESHCQPLHTLIMGFCSFTSSTWAHPQTQRTSRNSL